MSAPRRIVVMGVAGCGKSTVGEALASALQLPFVEGDAFHAPASVAKMRRGEPLDDADREGWLQALAAELAARPRGVVLACSALKRAYRDRLRAAAPGLAFLHLALSREEALRRVASRHGHYYPALLVDSQFDTLQDPSGEPGVVTIDARLARPDLLAAALQAFNHP